MQVSRHWRNQKLRYRLIRKSRQISVGRAIEKRAAAVVGSRTEMRNNGKVVVA